MNIQSMKLFESGEPIEQ